MDRKISIFEDVSKELVNIFFKKTKFKEQNFSFYFDETITDYNDNKFDRNLKSYNNFDDIPIKNFNQLENLMNIKFNFNKDIIKKYVLLVKNIENYDVDVLCLILKSIQLQCDIIKLKCNHKINFETFNDFENFVIENIYYNLEDYDNILKKFYIKKNYKIVLMNIFVMIYNYSIYYSIEKIKNIVYIKKN
tara:strand:- start:87 stop:659 length:573 start_codon:yes stop_codon:yes gene_type:complete